MLDARRHDRALGGRRERAGGLGPARLLGPGEPDHRHAGQATRYVQLAADPDLFNRWEAGQDPGPRPDPGPRGRQAGRGGRGALRRRRGPRPWSTRPRTRPSRRCCWPCPPRATSAWPSSRSIRPRSTRRATPSRPSWPCTWATCCGGCTAACRSGGEFSADARAAGKRALRNACCDLLAADPRAVNVEQVAFGHFGGAANMTDAIGGLSALMPIGGAPAERGARGLLRPVAGRAAGAGQVVRPAGPRSGQGAIGRILGLTAHPPSTPATPTACGPWSPGLRQRQSGPLPRPEAAPATASWPTRSWPSTASTR